MTKTFSKQFLFAIAAIIIIVIAATVVSLQLRHKPEFDLITVQQGNITQGVDVDGTVVAAQDASLSFQKNGNIAEIDVKVGDQVKKGQTLMKLDTKDASAAINQAQAALQAAQANYQKTLNGATSQDVAVAQAAVTAAQTALDNATKSLAETQKQQDLLVNNALTTMLSGGLTAIPAAGNSGSATVTVSGTYSGTAQGQYLLSVYNSGNGLQFKVSGLETTQAAVKNAPVALGDNGLFVQTAGIPGPNDSWTINIPNTQSSSYLGNYNAYNAALETRTQTVLAAQNLIGSSQAALVQAQAALQLKQTAARPEDIASAKASVDGAAANLQTAQNSFANSLITAPIDGIVTDIEPKIGELATPGKPVLSLISLEKFQIQAYLSEADLAKVKIGDQATVTLDAYGPTANFNATVLSIDPAATLQNGINTYKATLEFGQMDDRIKTGMAANVIITDQTHNNVLLIPQSAVITKNNDKFVLIPGSNGQTQQVAIQTGISDLKGNIEVTSGLQAGQQIVTLGQ